MRKILDMTLIHDQKNDVVGYLFNHLIISIKENKLIGIILGNSVYSSNAKLIGTYFKEKITDTKGETIAILKTIISRTDKLPDRHSFIEESWEIIKKIKAHIYSPIQEKSVWSKKSLIDALSSF